MNYESQKTYIAPEQLESKMKSLAANSKARFGVKMKGNKAQHLLQNTDLQDFPANATKALLALLEFGSVRIASKHCKVSEAQIYRYLNQPDFKQRLRELRRINFEEAALILQRFAKQAALTYVEVMQDTDAPQFVRLNAARLILEAGQNSLEMAELQAELDELKQLVYAKSVSPNLRLLG